MNIFLAQMASQSMRVSEIVWSAFMTSDSLSKGIVVLLGVGSITAWCIIGTKILTMISCSRTVDGFMKTYDKTRSPLTMGLFLEKESGPLKNVCEVGLKELCNVLGIEESKRLLFYKSGSIAKKLSPSDLEKIRVSMNRQVNLEVLALESGMPILSICVTVAPFLGLFGTVWGVMGTFMAIANTGAAELTALAPGISGALLTTVVGLFVAIPSVLFNIIINGIQNKVCLRMDVFLDDFVASLSLENAGETQQ